MPAGTGPRDISAIRIKTHTGIVTIPEQRMGRELSMLTCDCEIPDSVVIRRAIADGDLQEVV